ncbi:MAG TPA: glycosyltransferase [Baekduia sp.]|nr:glycosyltransferase [Baekduia sp.]
MRPDVLFVELGSTAGLRAAEAELRDALERAGASVRRAAAAAPREVRTFALTDLGWARAARRAARRALHEERPRAVLYSTTTAALLWPQPGAIRFDALAATSRPGRHGVWQRPVERRRLEQAPLLVPQDPAWAEGTAAGARTPVVVVPIPVEPSGPPGPRDLAAVTYAANPAKKGLDRVLAAWAAVRRAGEELVVGGIAAGPPAPGVRYAGLLAPDAWRALVRRARVYVTAPRREDYGLAQLEALADGCRVVSTTAPGPYAALAVLRALEPGLVVTPDGLAGALRAALDAPQDDWGPRALEAVAPFRRAAVDRVVAEELLPALLAR